MVHLKGLFKNCAVVSFPEAGGAHFLIFPVSGDGQQEQKASEEEEVGGTC